MNIFIISWAGQHENAHLIAEQVLKITTKVSIIFSDPNSNFNFNVPCNLIKRPNDLFWADKFKSCLDSTGDDGFLLIHADCTCTNWELLVKRCSFISLNLKELGVWAPQIDGTPFDLSSSGMFKIYNGELVLSALTDGIVFYLSPQIISRMRQAEYEKNKFGWGIARLFCATAHVNNKLVVIDTTVKVHHPSDKRGYSSHAAHLGRIEFLKQFSMRERIEIQLLDTYVQYNRAKIAALPRENN